MPLLRPENRWILKTILAQVRQIAADRASGQVDGALHSLSENVPRFPREAHRQSAAAGWDEYVGRLHPGTP